MIIGIQKPLSSYKAGAWERAKGVLPTKPFIETD